MWMGGNQTDAEEALSIARLKAWEKLPQYAAKMTNPKAWLTRMTHNLCVDIHRKHQIRAKHTENIDTMAIKNREGIEVDSPESAILRYELKVYIRHGINSLPATLREPLILLYYYQMSYADIARKLTLSKNNVYKRIQLARNYLKKYLNKYFSEDNHILKQDNYRNLTGKKLSVETSKLANFSIAIIKKSSLETINYQVTALCLEKLSVAS